MSEQNWDEYEGSLTLPGEQEPRNISVALNMENGAVKVRLGEPIGGTDEWDGSSVKMARRLKYNEIVFSTTGLPKEPVELTWKFNASLLDDSLAGVVIARPNELRITGERGFTLSRAMGS